MNIIGTMFLVDEANMNVLRNNLMSFPPPGGGLATGTMLCIDMDDSDDSIEQQFPLHAQKGTLLCPPPSALYKEIDGDQEGFIMEYNMYLDNDPSVQDFIASMLLYLHIGGHILLYTPTPIDSDAIWLNTLQLFFYTRYGITIGTGINCPSGYDPSFDIKIANMLFAKSYMEVLDFIYSVGANSITMITGDLLSKVLYELEPYCYPGDNPMDLLYFIRNNLLMGGPPAYKPAVMFGR